MSSKTFDQKWNALSKQLNLGNDFSAKKQLTVKSLYNIFKY